MGKWDRRNYARTRWRHYKDYNWSPPRDEPCPDPETEVWQDNVPMWEKKFCYKVARMPWKKVLSTRNFMHCHSNILTWDDYAGEEAFNTAKKRFWDELNGLPSETQPPNPDLYNDEINWNPYIDPELSKELDRVYFNPDDKYYLPSPSEDHNGWPEDNVQDKAAGWNNPVDDTSNPTKNNGLWESHHDIQATGWNDSIDDVNEVPRNNDPWESHHNIKATGWDDSVGETSKVAKKDNPWESHRNIQATEVKDNSWGGARNNSWDTKKNDNSDMSNTWKNDSNTWKNGSNTWKNEGNGWQDRGTCLRNWNQSLGKSFQPSQQNNNYRAQEFGSHQGSRVPNYRGNRWGQGSQQSRDNCNYEVRGSGNVYRGRGRYGGCRKREGPDYNSVNCKGPKLQGDQSPRYWNSDNNKRVSFGGQWS